MPGPVHQRDYETQFLLEGYRVSANQLHQASQARTDFARKVIAFAQQWVSDRQDFEFTTSGSTGKPQKIKFSLQQIQAIAQLTQHTFGFQAGDHALLCLDTDFIAGKMMIVRALESGMNLVCASPTANPLTDLPVDSKIDFAAFVPYQLEAILDNPGSTRKLSQISQVIVGGAAVSAALVARLQAQSTQFYETYGMTETLTHVAIRKLNPPEAAFHALPGVTLSLDHRLCLNIHARHISNEPIRTNDLVTIDSDTSFRLIGRYDNLVNTAGVKISPEDVEQKIASMMNITLPGRAYFVGGVQDSAFGEKVVLFIESDALPEAQHQHLAAQFRAHLKKWEVPKQVICMPSFKRTLSGKVIRKETLQRAFVP